MAFSKSHSCRSSSKSTNSLPFACGNTDRHGSGTRRWAPAPQAGRRIRRRAGQQRRHRHVHRRRAAPRIRMPVHLAAGEYSVRQDIRHELLHPGSYRIRAPAWCSNGCAGAKPTLMQTSVECDGLTSSWACLAVVFHGSPRGSPGPLRLAIGARRSRRGHRLHDGRRQAARLGAGHGPQVDTASTLMPASIASCAAPYPWRLRPAPRPVSPPAMP